MRPTSAINNAQREDGQPRPIHMGVTPKFDAVSLRLNSKGLCHEDIAVLGQFYAEVITYCLTRTQNAPLEIKPA